VAQVEEPGERSGAPGARGGVAIAFGALRSPNGKQDDGEHGHAENDSREPDRFDVENPSRVKCHAPLFAAVEGQH
jgi:hypothetical protein